MEARRRGPVTGGTAPARRRPRAGRPARRPRYFAASAMALFAARSASASASSTEAS